MSDRYRDLSPSEQTLWQMRRDGIDPVDRWGRPRAMLGSGPESQLVRGLYEIRKSRAPTVSEFLTTRDFERAYTGVATSNLHGWILNTFVTIAWRLEVSADWMAGGYQAALQSLMRAWFRDRRQGSDYPPFAGIWVKEIGKKLGLHSHLLVHVPYPLRHDFRRWVINAVHRLVEAKPDLTNFSPPKRRLVHVSQNFNNDTRQQWNVFKYLMKGLDPDETLLGNCEASHVRHLVQEFTGIRTKHQGTIIGRRVGVTTHIGPKALNQLATIMALPTIWPRCPGEGETLRYDDGFLRDGETQRCLRAIDI